MPQVVLPDVRFDSVVSWRGSMKRLLVRLRRWRVLKRLVLSMACLFASCTFCWADSGSASRYLYGGDGRINLLNPKNGAVFDGSYRAAGGAYDEEALKAIQRVFGAPYGEPLSRISLRLIEFIDFLQDRLEPGARIQIVSGWRSPQYNTKLRSKGRLAAKASLHQYGMAADIKIDKVPSERVWNYVKELGFGGVGYYHGQLVHVDVGPARSWDETTSGVGTDISEDNKLIGLITDFDRYRPGDVVTLRFIRMTAFPIGVRREFVLNRVDRDGSMQWVTDFKPSFARQTDGDCPEFADIGEMLGIQYQLPETIPPGRYKINAAFCNRLWDAMPREISTPELEIARP